MADAMPTNHFIRNALTGGTTGCLDAINGSRLEEGYTASVTTTAGLTYDYRLSAASGAAESSPDIISPDTSAGNKRWVLTGVVCASITAGTSAPTLKFKKLTGTTASTEGANVTVAHGLTESKILSVSVIVTTANPWLVPPHFTAGAESQYEFLIYSGVIGIYNHATNSGNILSRPFTVLITYEA